MSRRRQLSDEEEALWAGFARSITPLKPAKPGGQNEPEVFRDTVSREHSGAIADSKPSRHAA